MEWNRIEWNRGATQVERKEREHTRRCDRPTGGWAMRVSQQDIVSGKLGRAGGPSQSIMGLLESHAIPGVVLHGLSIVHVRDNKKEEERKIVRAK